MQQCYDYDIDDVDTRPEPEYHSEYHTVFWHNIEFKVRVDIEVLVKYPSSLTDPGEVVLKDIGFVREVSSEETSNNVLHYLLKYTDLPEHIAYITEAEWEEGVADFKGYEDL